MEFNFQRQLYIEDLYVPKKIINAFDWVEFESIEIFKKCVKEDLYNIKNGTTCHIHINNKEDFIFINHLYGLKPDFFDKMRVYIEFDDIEIFKESIVLPINEGISFGIILNDSCPLKEIWDANKEWVKNNRVIIKMSISEPTLEDDMLRIIETYNMDNQRFFLLDIDYESFQNISLKDLDRIEYWFYYIRIWIGGKIEESHKLTILSYDKRFVKRLFISNDLILYLDSYKDPIWCFPILEHLDEDGNSIDTKTLNYLHMYIDLHPNALQTEHKFFNYLLISPRQILKMGYYINEIPEIMGLIQRWLYA